MPTNPPSPQDEQAGAAVESLIDAVWHLIAPFYEPSEVTKDECRAAVAPILTRLQQAARDEGLEMARKAAESEPELPGEMPELAKLAAAMDPQEYSRGLVRVTKRNIMAAIRALSQAEKERG